MYSLFTYSMSYDWSMMRLTNVSAPLVGGPVRHESPDVLDQLRVIFSGCGFLDPGLQMVQELFGCKYSFIGPAPRFLYATFRGDRGSRRNRRKCLEDLRFVRDFVAEQFCVEHAGKSCAARVDNAGNLTSFSGMGRRRVLVLDKMSERAIG